MFLCVGFYIDSCSQGKVYAWAGDSSRKLKGGAFCLDFPSVGATETLMMAACLAEGKSVLTNVAQVLVFCLFILIEDVPYH